MKYIDADKIRTEIKRLKAENNCGTDEFIAAKDIAYDKVFDFLETLEEPVTDCHDLEDEIKKFIEKYGYERGEDKLLIAIVARHFWNKGYNVRKEE